MKKFSEMINGEVNEAERTVSAQIKKVKATIKKSVTNLYPEAFNVEKKNTDAGMGGYNYIQVSFNGGVRPKDIKEIEAVKKSLEKDFQVKYNDKTYTMSLYPEDMNIDESEVNEATLDDVLYKNLTRYIPTGSKVYTELSDKSLGIKVIYQISTGPYNTKEVPGTERRLKKDMESFVEDVEKEIKLKDVSTPPYIFMYGVNKAINFIYELRLTVGSKPEGNKLAKLDEALEFKKNYNLQNGE